MADGETKVNVYEEKLFESISKTNSVFAFLQSFGLEIIVYGAVFLAGYHKAKPMWLILPTVVLVIKDIWSAERERKRFDEIIKALRDENKDLILADPHQLPPWVHFPDVERCNWLNKLLFHFWPHICTFVTDKIKNEVDPAVTKQIPGLKFQKMSLGSLPPTISGVKVYDKKVSSSHLIIDVNLCYAGDSEFRFSYRGLPGGVENFQIRGTARIDFLILETLPFFGGVEFSFLGRPKVDFMLTGSGSLGFIEEALRMIINDQISSLLVFPKKMGTVWMEGHKHVLEDPEGVIRINVVGASTLETKDISVPFSSNKSDPYAVVSYGSKTFCSQVIENSNEPRWDLWCEFIIDESDTVNIKVMDSDYPDPNDLIGMCSLSVLDIKKRKKIDSWFKLVDCKKGSVHIRACFLQIKPDVTEVQYPPEDLSFLSTYILIILVKSAQNLLLPRSYKKPSSSVHLSVGTDTQETKTVENTDNPVFDQVFTFFVNNPDFNKLRAKVVDEETKREIGIFTYSLRKLLSRKDMEIVDQHFPLLDSASDSTVVLSMRLRVIKNVFF